MQILNIAQVIFTSVGLIAIYAISFMAVILTVTLLILRLWAELYRIIINVYINLRILNYIGYFEMEIQKNGAKNISNHRRLF